MADDPYAPYLIKRYQHWTAYVHTNASYLGWCVVWANRANATDLIDTTDDERTELFEILEQLKAAIVTIFQPDWLNYTSLGNETPHLHVHLVPRYAAPRTFANREFVDARWGKNYSPYDHDFKLPLELVTELRAAIAEQLEQSDA